LVDAAEEVREMLIPSRLSVEESSFTTFGTLSCPLEKLKEALLLGVLSPSSNSSSLESLS
jgi:hypothetical protein